APERVEDFTSNGDAAPIDPSFLEERRVAVVLRDVLADPHLAALIDDIDAEPIDIGEALAPQTHVARHMQGQHVADSDAAYNDPGSDGSGDILLDELDDGFSAKPDSDEEYKGRGRYAGMTQGIIDALRAPRPGRVHYDPQQAERQPQSSGGQFGEFRGRRGIAAEDPDQLQVADSGGRVEFTPSPHPDSSRPASPQPEDSRGPKRKRLGQYQPRYADSDTEFDPKHPPGSAKKPAARGKTGRRNVRWTRQEEECFVKALVEHGPHWSLILEHHGEDGIVDSVLGSRTRGNLKDKARTIKLRLLREGRELGPFADATGSL
ncbi:TTAGGG repeat binding factor, partial [Coemansia nantahalensis]